MTAGWTCPDCAEEVPRGASACPYCGCGAPGAATGATRSAWYGYCPTCRQSRWEGAPGRCGACGAQLGSRQSVEVPLTTTSSSPVPEPAAAPEPAAPEPAAAPAEGDTAAAATIAPKESSPGRDPVELIRSLGLLRDEGLLTNEEFEAKRLELLKRL